MILQVGSYKLRGVRIFRVAPHPSPLSRRRAGRSRASLCASTIITLMLVLLGLATLKVRSAMVIIIGLGKTGLSCVDYFLGRGVTPLVIDTRADPPGKGNFPPRWSSFTAATAICSSRRT